MKKNKILLASISMLALVGCHNASANNEHDASHFEYDHQNEWVQISGNMQSPINIVTASTVPLDMSKELGKIVIHYNDIISSITNNGHSIQVADGGTAHINGRAFELTQFHFHAQSEHTINDKSYPMEAHFVHQEQDGRLAVIAVFFEIGGKNNAFDSVLHNIDNHVSAITLNPQELIPENKSYYHYLGSLTTPPLTENVEWYVFKAPIQISTEQLSAFHRMYSHNNRETQPLNDRVVVSCEDLR